MEQSKTSCNMDPDYPPSYNSIFSRSQPEEHVSTPLIPPKVLYPMPTPMPMAMTVPEGVPNRVKPVSHYGWNLILATPGSASHDIINIPRNDPAAYDEATNVSLVRRNSTFDSEKCLRTITLFFIAGVLVMVLIGWIARSYSRYHSRYHRRQN